jgi:hypothetical protein
MAALHVQLVLPEDGDALAKERLCVPRHHAILIHGEHEQPMLP